MSDKIYQVDVYPDDKAPDAARFNRGTNDVAGIQEAIDSRVNLSREQSTKQPTPGK
jgi:hypothetical protein